MLFEQVIANLAQELRLPDLRPDENGACALKLDDGVYAFNCEEDGAAFFVRTRVASISRSDDDAMAQLLAANFFVDGIGGYALGVDLNGDVFLTQRFLLEQFSFPQFLVEFARYVGASEYWTGELIEGGQLSMPGRASDVMNSIAV
ncbi:MAG TPA: type III secretion system chaperone [Ramlibacter sp.]|nr:type III secretion system chaperone [Ramlibacter sp.]